MPYRVGEFYEAGNNGERSMGRSKNKKVHRGGGGSRTRPSLGSGLAERAARAIERRKKMLSDI